MKHSFKVFFGLLLVSFVSNVYGVDYVKAVNFPLLSGDETGSGVFPIYNVDTIYKKVMVKAYKMTTYFGEYIKESEYPIWEMTATYNDAGYIASKTDEAKDQHTVFHYAGDGNIDKISIYYLSTGKQKEEKYPRWYDYAQYYSQSNSYGNYRCCYEHATHTGRSWEGIFDSYFNPDGIIFIVRCWGQTNDGLYFFGTQSFSKSESWLKQNGFQGVWKHDENFKKIFKYCMNSSYVSFFNTKFTYYNEYGLPSSWKLQKKDGQLIQAQNKNYCYEYTWSN